MASLNKISIDVAADTCSIDPFSFAGFVCVQDQRQAKLLECNRGNGVHKQSIEFEFITTEQSFVCDPIIKNSTADISISNGEGKQRSVSKQRRRKASVGATRSVDNSTHGAEASKGREKEIKGQNSSSWFGKKMLMSIFFPCKASKAVEPSLRGNRMQI